MNCDLCGRNRELVDAVVEGSMLKVCGECSKFGYVVAIPHPKAIPEEKNKTEDDIEVVVEKYSDLVKKARERKKLTQDKLAKDIGEKISVISQIEVGRLKPSFKIAKKLEIYLRIKLIEKVEKINVSKDKKKIDFKNKTLTIGDLLKK